jgi:hypothetical protein
MLLVYQRTQAGPGQAARRAKILDPLWDVPAQVPTVGSIHDDGA